MKQRNHTFDLLCGICIVRMMMLHITNACSFGNESWWTPVMDWTYYFMSFFFFKAGYFNKTVSGDSKAFCKKKFKQLMVPYLVWGLIGNAVYFFFVWFILDPKNTMVKMVRINHLWESSQFYGNAPCWFLFSFFIAYIVAHFIAKVPPLLRVPIPERFQWNHRTVLNFKIHWFLLSFPFISYWLWTKDNPLWLSLSNIFIGIYLFYLGRLWHFLMEKLKPQNTIIISTVFLLIFIYLNIKYGGKYTMSENLWEGNVWIITVNITLVLCGLSGLLISLRLPHIPVLNYIGQHSMVFFVVHYPLMILYKMIRSANVRTLRGHWDDYTLLILILFGVCFLLVPYVERVPWLSGRFKK